MILGLLDPFSPCILVDENMEFVKDVTKEEIFIVLSHINSLKAPGSYKIQASFYQRY